MNATKHIVSKITEDCRQYCIVCGEKIADYSNILYLGEPPVGYPPGEIYVYGHNPQITSVEPPRNITINHCSK